MTFDHVNPLHQQPLLFGEYALNLPLLTSILAFHDLDRVSFSDFPRHAILQP